MQDRVIDVHIQKLTLMGELFHVRRIHRHNSNVMSYLMNCIYPLDFFSPYDSSTPIFK
jgi:hypothetical protein